MFLVQRVTHGPCFTGDAARECRTREQRRDGWGRGKGGGTRPHTRPPPMLFARYMAFMVILSLLSDYPLPHSPPPSPSPSHLASPLPPLPSPYFRFRLLTPSFSPVSSPDGEGERDASEGVTCRLSCDYVPHLLRVSSLTLPSHCWRFSLLPGGKALNLEHRRSRKKYFSFLIFFPRILSRL